MFTISTRRFGSTPPHVQRTAARRAGRSGRIRASSLLFGTGVLRHGSVEVQFGGCVHVAQREIRFYRFLVRAILALCIEKSNLGA